MRTGLIMTLICLSALTCIAQDTQRGFHLRFTPGIDFAQLTISNSPEYRQRNIRLGGEVEFFLPGDNKKWSIMLEPAYQSFSQESAGFRYESIEASLGVRYRVFLKNKSYFFVNAISLLDVPLVHTQRYSLGANGNIILKDDSFESGFAGGVGYGYRRFSLEGRYYTQREREGTQLALPYYYRKTSLILGFRLF